MGLQKVAALFVLSVALCYGQTPTKHISIANEIDVNMKAPVWAVRTSIRDRHLSLNMRIQIDGLCLAEELDVDGKVVSTQNCAGTSETVDPLWKNSALACKSAILHSIHRWTSEAAMRRVTEACRPDEVHQ